MINSEIKTNKLEVTELLLPIYISIYHPVILLLQFTLVIAGKPTEIISLIKNFQKFQMSTMSGSKRFFQMFGIVLEE